MALAESPVVPRDSGAGAGGSSNTLTTGAIAGIACGAGALFLGAAGLFIIYWRRQRQYDREDNSDAESFDERGPPGAMAPAVTYTMDYKMDDPQHHEDSQGSASIYAPEKASTLAFSPLSAPDMASAMPTHPAYIPRALVRGSSTPSSRSTATTSPPPFPSPPYPPSMGSLSKTQPDDTMIQAYLTAAAAAREANATNPGVAPPARAPSTTRHHRLHPSFSSSASHPPPMAIPPLASPPHSASSTTATTDPGPSSTSRRKFLPPRLALNSTSTNPTARPLQGKEATTISGPLAFPEHCFPPPGAAGAEDDEGDETAAAATTGGSDGRRTFRSRRLSGGGGGKSGHEGEGEGKKKGKRRSDRNSGGGGGGGGGGGNRHYAEIEIGRGSDIW